MDTDRTELIDLAAKNLPMQQKLLHLYEAWAERCGVIDWSLLAPVFANLYAGGALK